MHGYSSFRPQLKNTIIIVGSWSQEDNAACLDIVKELLQCIFAPVIMLCLPSQFYNCCTKHTVEYTIYNHTHRCVCRGDISLASAGALNENVRFATHLCSTSVMKCHGLRRGAFHIYGFQQNSFQIKHCPVCITESWYRPNGTFI